VLKLHEYYLGGKQRGGSDAIFHPPTGIHAFSNLRRTDFALSEAIRKTWTHDTLVSLLRETNGSVRIEVRSVRNDGGFFKCSRYRVYDVERKRLDEILRLFAE
jgi:hypothetical protein